LKRLGSGYLALFSARLKFVQSEGLRTFNCAGCSAKITVMAESITNVSQTKAPVELSVTDKSDGGSSPKLRRLATNAEGHCGPHFWQAFRETVAHLYSLSLPNPSDEARFSLSTGFYVTTKGILMHCQGTAFIMTRGPAQIARGADQLLILLQIEGSVETDYAGRRARREAGDVEIIDYARPFHSVANDYVNLIVHLTRESVPVALLALEPHGLIFPCGSGAARLIGAAMQKFYAQADDLAVSEAEAAIEGIVALTTAFARLKLAGDEAHHLESRRKAALEYIDAHLAKVELGPDEIAGATNVSRASLYRLLAAEGGIRAVLLKRRLDESLRLMLTDAKAERSLKEIANCCGFGGASQFSRAFRARFGAPPQQFCALLRQQDLDWHKVRLIADGFDQDSVLWRQLRSSEPKQSSGTD